MSLRMQADDFLNTYHVLKDSHETAMKKAVSQETLRALSTMGPSVVCLAFAVELYIKDIYHALNKKVPRKHKIIELYELLPELIQKEIFLHDAISGNSFNTRGTIFSPKTSAYTAYDGFIDQLKAISNGFEKWRYSYESRSLQYDSSFALAFIQAVASTADKIRRRAVA